MSSIKKVIEVLASSEKSFEDALQHALTEASATVQGIKSIYIKDQSCRVRDNKIVEYRVTAKISFEVRSKGSANPQAATADTAATTGETPVPAGDGSPDYSRVQIKTQPELPREVEPGGSATEAQSGGGYSG